MSLSTSEPLNAQDRRGALAALRLLRSLEARGLILAVDDRRLFVAPRDLLTTADDVAIRQRRDELCALLADGDRRCVA